MLLRGLMTYAIKATLHLNARELATLQQSLLPAAARAFAEIQTDLKLLLLECIEVSLSLLAPSHPRSLGVVVEDNVRVGLGHLLASKTGKSQAQVRVHS